MQVQFSVLLEPTLKQQQHFFVVNKGIAYSPTLAHNYEQNSEESTIYEFDHCMESPSQCDTCISQITQSMIFSKSHAMIISDAHKNSGVSRHIMSSAISELFDLLKFNKNPELCLAYSCSTVSNKAMQPLIKTHKNHCRILVSCKSDYSTIISNTELVYPLIEEIQLVYKEDTGKNKTISKLIIISINNQDECAVRSIHNQIGNLEETLPYSQLLQGTAQYIHYLTVLHHSTVREDIKFLNSLVKLRELVVNSCSSINSEDIVKEKSLEASPTKEEVKEEEVPHNISKNASFTTLYRY